VLVPKQTGAGALSDAASKPIFIEGPGGWKEAAARMGVSCAMLIDTDGVVRVTRELSARVRFSDPDRIAVQESGL
jgi:thiamine biosynthesis lipoprotein